MITSRHSLCNVYTSIWFDTTPAEINPHHTSSSVRMIYATMQFVLLRFTPCLSSESPKKNVLQNSTIDSPIHMLRLAALLKATLVGKVDSSTTNSISIGIIG
jgi:hypothetical protein